MVLQASFVHIFQHSCAKRTFTCFVLPERRWLTEVSYQRRYQLQREQDVVCKVTQNKRGGVLEGAFSSITSFAVISCSYDVSPPVSWLTYHTKHSQSEATLESSQWMQFAFSEELSHTTQRCRSTEIIFNMHRKVSTLTFRTGMAVLQI